MRWAGSWCAWYQLSLSLARTRLALSWNLYKPGPRRTQVYPLTSTPSASSTPHSCWGWEDILISGDLPDFPWSHKALLQGQFPVYHGRSKASPVVTSVPSVHSRSSSEVAELSEPGPATPQSGLNHTSLASLSINPSLLLIGYYVTRLGLQASTEIWSYLSLGVGVDSLSIIWELELSDIHTKS